MSGKDFLSQSSRENPKQAMHRVVTGISYAYLVPLAEKDNEQQQEEPAPQERRTSKNKNIQLRRNEHRQKNINRNEQGTTTLTSSSAETDNEQQQWQTFARRRTTNVNKNDKLHGAATNQGSMAERQRTNLNDSSLMFLGLHITSPGMRNGTGKL